MSKKRRNPLLDSLYEACKGGPQPYQEDLLDAMRFTYGSGPARPQRPRQIRKVWTYAPVVELEFVRSRRTPILGPITIKLNGVEFDGFTKGSAEITEERNVWVPVDEEEMRRPTLWRSA